MDAEAYKRMARELVALDADRWQRARELQEANSRMDAAVKRAANLEADLATCVGPGVRRRVFVVGKVAVVVEARTDGGRGALVTVEPENRVDIVG